MTLEGAAKEVNRQKFNRPTKQSSKRRKDYEIRTWVGGDCIFHFLVFILVSRSLRGGSTVNFKIQSVMSAVVSRPKFGFEVKQENKSNYYPEAMGIATLILGKAFCGFDGTTFCCFGAFSVVTGEEGRGRLDDSRVCTIALPWVPAGS
mgnify:CR=1 FL=1